MSELVYNARSIAGETTFKSNDQPPSTADTTTTTTATTTTDTSSKDDQQHFNMGDKAVVQLLNKLDEVRGISGRGGRVLMYLWRCTCVHDTYPILRKLIWVARSIYIYIYMDPLR